MKYCDGLDMEQQHNSNGNSSNEATILEQGDIYFFYRPKKNAQEVKGIEDVRRFFMVTAPENEKNKSRFYRLFVIGKKSLPEIRTSEARASERYWARVGGIFEDQNDLIRDLFSDEFRKGDVARPAGVGKYVLVRHQNHTELAYILEIPEEPGEAQKELGIEKEASYIISVINPTKPTPSGYPSSGESPKYPEEILKEFENDNFVPLKRNTKLIDFQDAQIILIGAREGKDTIKRDLGISIGEPIVDSDIFDKLKVRMNQFPTKPLTEGKLE
jgi:hypothetical protein